MKVNSPYKDTNQPGRGVVIDMKSDKNLRCALSELFMTYALFSRSARMFCEIKIGLTLKRVTSGWTFRCCSIRVILGAQRVAL